MTTPTTSRVSEEMVNAAGQVFLDYDHFVPPTLLERALEAAIASQVDVVAVSEVQEITRGNAGWASCFDGDEQFVRWSDLSAILNRGGK